LRAHDLIYDDVFDALYYRHHSGYVNHFSAIGMTSLVNSSRHSLRFGGGVLVW